MNFSKHNNSNSNKHYHYFTNTITIIISIIIQPINQLEQWKISELTH